MTNLAESSIRKLVLVEKRQDRAWGWVNDVGSSVLSPLWCFLFPDTHCEAIIRNCFVINETPLSPVSQDLMTAEKLILPKIYLVLCKNEFSSREDIFPIHLTL